MPYIHREDKTKIYYEEHGAGFPLVLVMGLGGTAEAWRFQLPDFSKHFRVIILDNRGVGRSDKPDVPYSTAIFAEDVKAILDELNIDKAFFLGLSMGGLIVQEFYHQYPELVKAMVLGCTGVGAGDPEFVKPAQKVIDALNMKEDADNSKYDVTKARAEVFYHAEYINKIPKFIEILMERAAQLPQPDYAYRRQLDACFLSNPELWNSPRLKNIKVPVLVYHGEEDQIWPLGNAKYLAKHIPGAKLEILENTAHMFFLENIGAFNNTVLSFLKAIK